MGRDRSILVTQKVTADLRTADKRDAFDPAEMIEPFVEAYRRGDSTGSSDGDESSDFGGDADHMEALAVEGGADRGEPGWASARAAASVPTTRTWSLASTRSGTAPTAASRTKRS